MIIHILHQGAALCGEPGFPKDWPEGHRWVSLEDKKLSNCPECRNKAAWKEPHDDRRT